MSRLLIIVALILFIVLGIAVVKKILTTDPKDEYYTVTPIFEEFDRERAERSTQS
jgi:hypothetical protein